MAIVNNTIVDPAGNPASGAVVTIQLVTDSAIPGFSTSATVDGSARIVADASGAWSADLTPNIDLLPTNTHYLVTENVGRFLRYVYAIIVPAGGPFTVREVLAAEPVGPDPLLPAGGGVSSVDGLVGTVNLAGRYVATSTVGAASGVASLGGDGKVPTAQLPASAGRTVVRSGFITTGNISTNVGPTWTRLNLPGIAVPAAVGDYVEFMFGFLSLSSANDLDAVVVASGVPVRYMSNSTGTPAFDGAPWWYFDSGFKGHAPPFAFTVTSADLTAGNVTVDMSAKGSGSGQLYASSQYPFFWRAINYGPVQ